MAWTLRKFTHRSTQLLGGNRSTWHSSKPWDKTQAPPKSPYPGASVKWWAQERDLLNVEGTHEAKAHQVQMTLNPYKPWPPSSCFLERAWSWGNSASPRTPAQPQSCLKEKRKNPSQKTRHWRTQRRICNSKTWNERRHSKPCPVKEKVSPIVLLLEQALEAFLINENKILPPSSKRRNTNIFVSDSWVFIEMHFLIYLYLISFIEVWLTEYKKYWF